MRLNINVQMDDDLIEELRARSDNELGELTELNIASIGITGLPPEIAKLFARHVLRELAKGGPAGAFEQKPTLT